MSAPRLGRLGEEPGERALLPKRPWRVQPNPTTPDIVPRAVMATLVRAAAAKSAVAAAPTRAFAATVATPARNAARAGGPAAAVTDVLAFPESEALADALPTVRRAAVARANSSTTVPGRVARDAADIAVRASNATRPIIEPALAVALSIPDIVRQNQSADVLIGTAVNPIDTGVTHTFALDGQLYFDSNTGGQIVSAGQIPAVVSSFKIMAMYGVRKHP